MSRKKDPEQLLMERFVASFHKLDDLSCCDEDPVPALLEAGIDPEFRGFVQWTPARLPSPRTGLDAIRRVGELPHLFEQLLEQFAWLPVDLECLRLFGNPPSTDFTAYANEMFADPVMNHNLLPARYVRFALAADCCYDAICFDLNRMRDGDCPVVRIEHESVLCFDRIDSMETVFPSCRAMMEHIIELADAK